MEFSSWLCLVWGFSGVAGYMVENAALYIPTLCLIVLQEDLESALKRAFKQQQRVNPALRVNTDIQVCCLCFDIFCYIYFTSVLQSQNLHVFSEAVSINSYPSDAICGFSYY